MGFDVHTIAIPNGFTPPAMMDRLITLLDFGVAVPGPTNAPVTGAALYDTGAGYTATPTAAAPATGNRSGATFTVSMALQGVAPNAIGATYAPGDTITLAGGTSSTAAILNVATTALVASPSVVAGGSGYVVGDFITLQGGAIVKVATVSSGAVATLNTIGTAGCNAGSFFANITSAGGLTQQSTTGVGTGATFTSAAANYGVGTVTIKNAGVYSVCATTFTQSATSGSGTGATFQTGTFEVSAIAPNAAGVGYSVGDAITFTGGSATRQASGVLTTNPINQPISILFTGAQFPASSYIVDFDLDAPGVAVVANKTTTGWTLTLTPQVTTGPVLATKLNLTVTM